MRSIILRNDGSVCTDSFIVISESPVSAIVKLLSASIGAIASMPTATATIHLAGKRFMTTLQPQSHRDEPRNTRNHEIHEVSVEIILSSRHLRFVGFVFSCVS